MTLVCAPLSACSFVTLVDESVPVSMVSTVIRTLALPLLVLLHLLFTLFSLLLRVNEAFSTAEPKVRRAVIPQHVALCLPSRLAQRRRRGSRYEAQRRALVETLKRAARWAVEDGVREVSVYSDLGMSRGVKSRISS